MKKHNHILLFIFILVLLASCAVPPATESPPMPTGEGGYSLNWLADLPADTILVQQDYEPTFFRPEASYPFGRVPAFTLYADGTLVYLDEGATFDQQQAMSVQLSQEATLSIVQEFMGLGFESLESYTDFCMTMDDGTEACIADASFTVLRATLDDGSFREVRSYANFSNEPAVLEEISLFLTEYSHPDAEMYIPEQAALFVQNIEGNFERPQSEWPLDPSILLTGTSETVGVILEGADLNRLIDTLGRNTGDYYFEVEGQGVTAYLVPWLPYTDYSEALRQAFPAPTPGPVPEPVFEISEAAKKDLASQLGISPDEIVVSEVEQVDWPNGCLGIDYLDIMCTEAIVPGYRLILETGGQRYEYRSDLEGTIIRNAEPITLPGAETPEAILILEPGPGSRIVSPLRIRGEANPTFEQTLVVEIVGANGDSLAVQPVTIQADIGRRGPFEAEIDFSISEETQGFVQVYAVSARDGGILHLSSVGVQLASTGNEEIQPVTSTMERIRIDLPLQGEAISSGVLHVEGFALASFEQTLVVELLDENGTVLVSVPVIVQALDLGLPGPFSADLPFSVAAAGAGRVVVRDPSPVFAGDVHISSVEVTLQP